MKLIHRMMATAIFLISIATFYLLSAQITEATSQNLVTFFSIVFGFYMTSIAILYNASYTKRLYKDKNFDNDGKSGVHILKSYLISSGYWSIVSISSVVLFTIFSTRTESGKLSANFQPIDIPYLSMSFDGNIFITSIILGIAVVNVFFMLLLLHTILDGMIEEAKG